MICVTLSTHRAPLRWSSTAVTTPAGVTTHSKFFERNEERKERAQWNGTRKTRGS